MKWATMPETAVNENSKLELRERDIDCTAEVWFNSKSDAISETQ